MYLLHTQAISKLFGILTIAVHAFVPWTIVLFILILSHSLPRPLFILIHLVSVVTVFAVVFHHYFNIRQHAHPFRTSVSAFAAIVLYEGIFWTYFYTGQNASFNFIDWILPAFLTVTVIYLMGKRR